VQAAQLHDDKALDDAALGIVRFAVTERSDRHPATLPTPAAACPL
jgi:hypothetical protein